MSDSIIRVAGLGKKYSIHHQRPEKYATLRDVIADASSRLLRGRQRKNERHQAVEEFWALKEVSFDVNQGDVVGIVGRNGAGKSTLLKVLSRITDPTTGRIEIDGRIASLLEVGTGFHPELTGRENIFLNGSILGMSRGEIRTKFDEIVAFAEVERFLDTPVKRYSSGMYVRLAFAVAAHLELEILIVDEVLAVGDSQFQKKCLGKIQDVAVEAGRTVLFVSHNMGTVAKLCNNVILMTDGRITERGDPAAVIARYLNDGPAPSKFQMNTKAADHPFILHSVEVLDAEGRTSSHLPNNESFSVRLTYELTAPMRQLRVSFRLHAHDTTVVLSSTNCDELGGRVPAASVGVHVVEVTFPAHLLNRGRYYLWVGIDIPMQCAVLSVDQAASFSVEAVGGMIADINDSRLGVVAPLLPWRALSTTT